MKAREVLEKSQERTSVHLVKQGCLGCSECKDNIDTALLALKEMVLQELNKYEPINPLHTIEDAKLYHKRILESVAKLFEEEKG